MDNKLKPCPLCGAHAKIQTLFDDFYIEIFEGRATRVIYYTKQEAIDAWNNRVEFNLSPKEIEELRKKFSSVIHDIPVSYYTEVRKPCIDECTQPVFTPDELDAIRRMFAERYPRARKLPEIEQAIIDKCKKALEGGSNEKTES